MGRPGHPFSGDGCLWDSVALVQSCVLMAWQSTADNPSHRVYRAYCLAGRILHSTRNRTDHIGLGGLRGGQRLGENLFGEKFATFCIVICWNRSGGKPALPVIWRR